MTRRARPQRAGGPGRGRAGKPLPRARTAAVHFVLSDRQRGGGRRIWSRRTWIRTPEHRIRGQGAWIRRPEPTSGVGRDRQGEIGRKWGERGCCREPTKGRRCWPPPPLAGAAATAAGAGLQAAARVAARVSPRVA